MIEYFDVESIEEIHNDILKISQGLKGFKDKQEISKVCDFVQNDLYYPTFVEKLAYIILVYQKIIFLMMEIKEQH